MVNRQVKDTSLHIRLGPSHEERSKRAHDLLAIHESASKELEDEKAVKFGNGVMRYIEGSSSNVMAKIIEERLPDKRSVEEILALVARRAALLIQGLAPDWSTAITADQLVSETTVPMVEYEPEPRDLHDAIITLCERGRISEGLAKGLLIVFEQVETAGHDPIAVAQVARETRAMVSAKLQHRSTEPLHPLLVRIFGNERNGIAAREFSELMKEDLSAHVGAEDQYPPRSEDDMRELVHAKIAVELTDLYRPPQLRF